MKLSKRHIPAMLAATVAAMLAISCANNSKNTEKTMEIDPMDGPVVEMTTTLGTMKIKLYNATPKHRDNFLKLASEGFYDGLLFHRVIPGFMIQGGDPLSKDAPAGAHLGTGGPGYTVAAEFDTRLHHSKGAIAAARLGDMANPRRASSGSQFYIVQSEGGCRHLDGQYTVYGQVIDGLDVIDKIASVATDPYDRPLDDVRIIKAFPLKPAIDSTAVADSLAAADSVAASDSLKDCQK